MFVPAAVVFATPAAAGCLPSVQIMQPQGSPVQANDPPIAEILVGNAAMSTCLVEECML